MRVEIPDAVIPGDVLEVHAEGRADLLYMLIRGSGRRDLWFALDLDGARAIAAVLVPFLRLGVKT